MISVSATRSSSSQSEMPAGVSVMTKRVCSGTRICQVRVMPLRGASNAATPWIAGRPLGRSFNQRVDEACLSKSNRAVP